MPMTVTALTSGCWAAGWGCWPQKTGFEFYVLFCSLFIVNVVFGVFEGAPASQKYWLSWYSLRSLAITVPWKESFPSSLLLQISVYSVQNNVEWINVNLLKQCYALSMQCWVIEVFCIYWPDLCSSFRCKEDKDNDSCKYFKIYIEVNIKQNPSVATYLQVPTKSHRDGFVLGLTL